MISHEFVVDCAWEQSREIHTHSGLGEFLYFQRTRHLPDGPTEWACAIGPPGDRAWRRCGPPIGYEDTIK